MNARSSTPLIDRAPVVLAVLGTFAAVLLARGPLEGVVHVQDEMAYRFQAWLYGHGELWVSPDSVPVPVDIPFTRVADGRWVGLFPPGWPLVLAPALLLGVPWLMNPVLHGITVWRGSTLASELAGARAGVCAAAILALSPQLLLLAASQMSHTLVAMLGVLGLEAALRWRARQGARTALALGACVGLAFLARPLCGALLGCGLAAVARPWRLRALLPGLGVVTVAVALQLANNLVITGDALRWPADLHWADFAARHQISPGCDALGLGASHGCNPNHPGYFFEDALQHAGHNLTVWARLLLGMPVLALLPLLAARARPRLLVGALCALGAVVMGYGLYWYEGTCYGARFYHLATPLVLVAAGVGLGTLGRWSGLATLGVGAACLGRIFTLLPELQGYWNVDGRLGRLAAGWDQGDAVVLVRAETPNRQVDEPMTGPSSLPPLSNLLAIYGLDLPGMPGPWFAPDTPELDAKAEHAGLPVWHVLLASDGEPPILSPQ